ncbi:MAG: hypothetical protein AAB574_02550 [Patescibacteria group bacterium]
MKLRYAVWVEIPLATVDFLKSFYLKKSGKDLTIENLHLSILWPFFINNGVTEETILEKIKNISVGNFEARLSKLLVLEQKNKKILAAEVEPKEKFQKIFGEVLMSLRNGIVFDKSVFSEGILPSFLPHVTIDYDFNGDMSTLQKQELDETFLVEKVDLYREEGEGRWVKI